MTYLNTTKHNAQKRSWRRAIAAVALMALPLGPVAATEFLAPVSPMIADQNYQFARLGGGNAVFDPFDQLHVVYWAGGFATSATTPSRVYHQRWSRLASWSAQRQIDDNSTQNGDFVGGRHPSIAITPDNTIWVAWQDHRHSGEAGNFINNIEIYARSITPSIVLGPEVRLTNTSAAHFGDNGYTPRIEAHADGRVVVLWYDFNANGSRSDLYVVRSDTNGVFDISGGLASQRLTDETERPAGFTQSFVIPDLAIGTDGTEMAVWTEGTTTGGPLLASPLPDPTAIIPNANIQNVASNTGSYFTPARVVASPDGGFWAVYTDTAASPRVVRIARAEPSTTTFGTPELLISAIGAHAEAADVAVDADGILHLVWIERPTAATTERTVRYGSWDPASPSPVEGVALTTDTAEYERPTVVLDSVGAPHILFEERIDSSTGQIWFVEPVAPTGVGDWMLLN